jgi:acyl-CoA reductase-like NAD-dependent aldehyde dehydrogenase
MEVRDRLYIDGAWVAPARTDTIDVLDSTTEEVIGTIPSGTAADVDRPDLGARAGEVHIAYS